MPTEIIARIPLDYCQKGMCPNGPLVECLNTLNQSNGFWKALANIENDSKKLREQSNWPDDGRSNKGNLNSIKKVCFKDWKVFNECILSLIEQKREVLKLTRAVRLIHLDNNQAPDLKHLETSTLSCGTPRWRFFDTKVFHYIEENMIPIIENPRRFYVYDSHSHSVIIRLTPTPRRDHLEVPSAVKSCEDRTSSTKWKIMEFKPPCAVTQPTPAGNIFSVESDKDKIFWMVADHDTYKEESILKGLKKGSVPRILQPPTNPIQRAITE